MIASMQVLLGTQGYSATGLNQLVADSGFPKGSIYHHFPGGKEEIAAAAVRKAGTDSANATRQAFRATDTAADAVVGVITWLAEQLRSSSYRYGCSIAAASLGVGGDAPELRQACADAFESWLDAVADGLVGVGWSADAARSDAGVILATIEGALVMSRATGTTDVLDRVCSDVERRLRERSPGTAITVGAGDA